MRLLQVGHGVDNATFANVQTSDPMCVAVLKIPLLREITAFELASYTLKMASFEENLDCAIRQACLVLSGNDCKDVQRICLQHSLSNWEVLGPIGRITLDRGHMAIHW